MFVTFLAVALFLCCSSLTVAMGCSNFPNSTQVVSLIASNYGTDQAGNIPTITLQTSPFGFEGYRVVCSSSSGIRNQYRFVSIVAYFTTSDANVSPPGVPIYVQFEFECANSIWTTTSNLLGAATTNRLPLSSDSPAINATSRTDCAYCLRPTSSLRMSDLINHCGVCTGCSQPLCTITDTTIPTSAFTQACCNYYSSDGVTCIAECSPPYFHDANRTCTRCNITCQNGGTLRTDACGCNCTAVSTGSDCSTCLCQNGGTCNADGTCTCPPGYSGQLCSNCTLTCPAGNYLNSSTCSCVCQCQNGGICSGSSCNCPPGYTGTLCENICPTSCPAGYNVNNCNCVPSCPCNGAIIQCGTYAKTTAGSNNVTITGTYLKCSIASNVTLFRQHALVAASPSSDYFGPGSVVLLKQLQVISVSPADYQCILNWQLLQHSASVALSSLGYKDLGLSYITGQGTVESINLDADSLSRIVASNDYTIGGSLDSSVVCPFRQLVQWLLTATLEVPSATCRNSTTTGTTVATFSVNCV